MQEYIVLVPNNIKNNIIKISRLKYYNYNIKYMTIEEFISKVTFTYNEETIYNLMKKYNYNYSTALVYLDNLYYINNKLDNNKMNKLKEIKDYLDNNNLLIYDNLFKEYIKNKEIYIYGYDYINKYYLSILKDYNYKIIDYKYNNYNIDNIYEFNYIDEEVIFVLDKICELINNKININNIKLIISNEYKEVIYRLFKIYNIPISILNRSIYSTYEVKKLLTNINDIDSISDSNIKDKIIKVFNKYSFIEDKEEVKELIINDLKNTFIEEDNTGIKVCSINDYFTDEDYVFYLGFNKENIPLYKDDEYFSDKEKIILGYDTSIELNINKKIEIIKKLHNIKNLTISYKLLDNSSLYTKSDLLDNINIIKDYKTKYNYSDMMNKILLTEKLDDLIKYNIKDNDLDILSSSYEVPYMLYDNSYKNIDKDKIYKYLDNKLLLSYTSLENFYKCKFRYYLSSILKINIIKDDFAIIIGNVCHYVLSHIDDKDFDSNKIFDEYLSKEREFTKRELFFLNNVKEELLFIIDTIRKQYTYSTFDKNMKEKTVYVNKDKNIKVTFKGVIDKVLYKEEDDITYVVVIDYKTGNTSINLNNIEYGLGLQLPIYLYLSSKMELKNVKVVGFYLQKLLRTNLDNKEDYLTEKEKTLRLEGYSIDEENILSMFDTTYNDSKLIKSMKTTSKGFSSYSKVLSSEEFNNIITNTDKLIDEATGDILNTDFNINPKVINGNNESCKFCEYKDICYLKEKDKVYINTKESEEDEE